MSSQVLLGPGEMPEVTLPTSLPRYTHHRAILCRRVTMGTILTNTFGIFVPFVCTYVGLWYTCACVYVCASVRLCT